MLIYNTWDPDQERCQTLSFSLRAVHYLECLTRYTSRVKSALSPLVQPWLRPWRERSHETPCKAPRPEEAGALCSESASPPHGLKTCFHEVRGTLVSSLHLLRETSEKALVGSQTVSPLHGLTRSACLWWDIRHQHNPYTRMFFNCTLISREWVIKLFDIKMS